MKKIIYLLVLILTAILILTCDVPIGLGTMINTDGPVLTITSPTPEKDQRNIQVGSYFTLSGKATGESAAARMEIQITRFDLNSNSIVALGREWRYEKNTWQWKSDSGVSWRNYTEADYLPGTMDASFWIVSGNNVSWSLPITLAGLPKGDYFFTVRVWDKPGYSNSNSVQKLKVYHDNDNPELVITHHNNLLVCDTADFSGYIYDPVKLPDDTANYINKWVSGSLSFGWEIDREIIGNYSLVIEITNRHDLYTNEGKVLYYRYEWEQNGTLPRYGIFTDEPVPTGYTKAGGAIPLGELAPRDPVTGVKTGETLPEDTFVPMQIIVRLKSGTGSEDLAPNKGWFAYRPKADEPWANIAFGYRQVPDEQIPSGALDSYFLWKGESNNNNYAYDNNGVASLSWRLLRMNDNLEPINDGADGSLTKPWTGAVDFNSAGKTQKSAWTFTAEERFGIGLFKISVKVKDVNGKEGGEYGAFFSIESNATPTIKGKSLLEPSMDTALFGDSAGYFWVKGIAQIEDTAMKGQNSLKVDRVTIAWIRQGHNFLENSLLYADRNYENWDIAYRKGNFNSYEHDVDGNRVWEISSGAIKFVTSTDGNEGGEDQEEYAFERKLNIFDDFDAGNSPLDGKTLLIRVYSGGISGKPKSSVQKFTTKGDETYPSILIQQITITKFNNTSESYEAPKNYNRKANGFDMLPAINKNDKVKLSGRWDDNSRTQWQGLSDTKRKSFFKNFSVKWHGETKKIEMADLVGSDFFMDGTWETAEYIFDANNTDPIISVTANITDINNNSADREEVSIIVETDNPTLIRISSDAGDGEYRELKDTDPNIPNKQNYIDIFLEFNKYVEFFKNQGSPPYYPPNPQNAPYLILNNGGRAFYYEGNGDSRLKFRYFIDGNADNSLPTAKKGFGGTSSHGKLNVTEIKWTNEYPKSSCVSAEGGTEVVISNSVYDPANALSLAGGKNIIIDKDAPAPESFVTTAGTARPHGRGSPVYITVNFNEKIVVPSSANASNFYLNLKGGNLLEKNARAVFENTAGAKSVTFLYEVQNGHDTSAAGAFLGISSINVNGVNITDIAGNVFIAADANTALPKNGMPDKQLVIDTSAPQVPTVTGLNSGRSYYGENITFNITGLESSSVTAEYCLNYDSANPDRANWVTVPAAYTIQGSAKNNYYINNIPLEINGTYNIAARQRDNATEPNISANPEAGKILQSVKVDRGELLVRLGSSTPDGIYKAGNKIEIDLVFRIPVYLHGSQKIPADILTYNLDGNAAISTELKGFSNGNKTWTFQFTVPEGAKISRLDVTGIAPGSLQFYDAEDADAAVVNRWINLSSAVQDSNGNRLPKSIGIVSGKPSLLNDNFSNSFDTGSAVRFYPQNNGYTLEIEYDRNIYRGDTHEKLTIEQIKTGYRIPAVLPEDRWKELFVGRSDITGNADTWRNLGNQLYQKGSNGAALGAGNELVSDTAVKYVLNYGIDTGDAAVGNVPNVTPAISYDALKDNMRAAEALSYFARDKEVSIVNDSSGRPRILRVTFAPPKAMPVLGAKYQWSVPAGFVKDFLESASDAMSSGDADIQTNDNNKKVLSVSGVEKPVIRINKGQIETIAGKGNARQAHQPLTSNVRIDGRTPDSTFQYRIRATTDNTGRLIMRANPGGVPNRLPNIGSQTQNENGILTYEATKRRPQSGNAANNIANGLNHWVPMAAWSGDFNSYTAPFQIGDENYNSGGMIVHIQSSANGSTDYSYEAAYRSVFVFNNMLLRGNNSVKNIAQALGNNNTGANLAEPALGRIYIRGGDTTSGEPSIPDFPIARDRSLSKKARLLTPLYVTEANINGNNFGNIIGNSYIPSTYNSNGQYLWFWVTWGVNVPAYVDFFIGQMHSAESYHTHTKDFYGAYVPSKEHYPVLPGRTTVVETRDVYGTQADGVHAASIYVGPVLDSPPPKDR